MENGSKAGSKVQFINRFLFCLGLFFVKPGTASEQPPARSLTAEGLGSFYSSPRQQVLSEEDIARISPTFISDLVSRTLSVQTVGQVLGGVTPSIFFRGASSEFTGVLWNGLEFNDPTSVSGGADILTLNREFSNTMAVIRGPETLFYGGESLAGMIIFERGDLNHSHERLLLSEYSTFQGLAEGRVERPGAQIFYGGSWLSTEGMSNVHDQTLQFDHDSRAQGSVSLLCVKETANGEVEALVNYAKTRTEDDLFAREDPNAESNSTDLQGRLTGRWRTGVFASPAENQVDFMFANKNRENFNPVDEANSSTYDSRYDGQKYKLKDSLLFDNSQRKIWLGVELISESVHARESYDGVSSENFSESQASLNTFAISSWNLPGQWKLDLGGRLEAHENTAWQFQLKFGETYALVSKAFKRPTLYQRFSTYGFRDLKTQQALLKEIGTQIDFNQKHRVKASVFLTDYTELIDFQGGHFQNSAQARSQGVEAQWKFTEKNLTQQLGLTWNEFFNLSPIQEKFRRPHWILREDFDFRVTHRNAFGLEGEWQSERKDLDELGQTQVLAAYQVWNAKWILSSGSDKNERWTLRWGNIFDAKYQQAYDYSTPGRVLSLIYEANN